MSLGLLRALSHSDNYVAMARSDEGDLVGACVGFFGTPARGTLHSHLAAVAPNRRSLGVGRAIKLHQRAWAFERGAQAITWTFDPLSRRNLVFNLLTLGATPTEFLTDHYGSSGDPMNAGLPTDRISVSWPVRSDPPPPVDALAGWDQVPSLLSEGPNGEPRSHPDPGSALVRIGTPADVIELRHRDRAQALEWRERVRATLGSELTAGAVVVAGTRQGEYVVDRSPG